MTKYERRRHIFAWTVGISINLAIFAMVFCIVTDPRFLT